MTEEFIYYLWKNKLLQNNLHTTSGDYIEIINVGEQNFNAGPDFLNSRLKINETEWVGNVEMHINASDWIKHNHNVDSNYDNVILHIVNYCDTNITTTKGEEIPCLEIKDFYNKSYFYKYKSLIKNKDWIACSPYINNVNSIIVNSFLERLTIERLERKSIEIIKKLELLNNNWNELFYQVLAKSFGFKVNAAPFELMAKSLNYDIILKHTDNLFQIEALLFGQAGLLNENIDDDYSKKLIQEYQHLSNKYNLTSIPGEMWKALRMRPVNFPSIRMAQFAVLLYTSKHLFSKVIEAKEIFDLEKLFGANPSEYWNTHYVFGKLSKPKSKSLGKESFYLILINTIIPVLFVYYKRTNNDIYRERALKFLSELNSEKNAIISRWEKLGIKANNAAQSQALLTLKEDYCTKRRCLDCSIGHNLINK